MQVGSSCCKFYISYIQLFPDSKGVTIAGSSACFAQPLPDATSKGYTSPPGIEMNLSFVRQMFELVH